MKCGRPVIIGGLCNKINCPIQMSLLSQFKIRNIPAQSSLVNDPFTMESVLSHQKSIFILPNSMALYFWVTSN